MKYPLFEPVALRGVFGLAAALVLIPLQAASPLPTTSTNLSALTRLTPAELAGVEVTSASRREEALMNAPSAIYVITDEDIRRSGAMRIPEALRMAPGMHVAQINANKWAVSSRGFNGRFANKQLVLLDGRTLYTPLFSGVYWDAVDTLLEDLDRIEVIRGPGGALWGANAVNGVINIVTKPADETQGLFVMGGAGSEWQGFGGFRYGGALATNLHYRVFAKAANHSDFREANGDEAADEWWHELQGLRLDWRPSPQDLVTFEADSYYLRAGDRMSLASPAPPYSMNAVERSKGTGASALARWTHTFSETSDFRLQTYYNRSDRENLVLDAEIDTYDLDFQHRLELGLRNEFIWGLGYRLMRDEIESTYSAQYDPPSRHDQLWSAFIQDRYAIVEDRLWLTLGSKLEHNDYTGWELQPSARLTLKPGADHTLWAAVSRAVRTPARFERTASARVGLPFPPNAIAVTGGDRGFESEKLIAYEIGYRMQPIDEVFLDLALFYNDYEDLRTSERGAIVPGPPLVVPIIWQNRMRGETYGLEFAPSWQVTPEWRLSAGYTLLKMNLRPDASTTDVTSELAEGDSPQQQVHLRSFFDLPHNVQFDSAVYYVDELPNQTYGGATVGDHTRLDLRLAWAPRPNVDISLVFQNLLDPRHPEFGGAALVTPTLIERSFYAKVAWRF